MQQDGRDVYSVRARHAVLAVVARNGGIFEHHPGGLLEQCELLFGAWFQRGVGADVVLQVFHIGHAAQGGQHAGKRARETESPRRDALVRASCFESAYQMVVQSRQASPQQRFHDDHRNIPFLQFAVQVLGVDVASLRMPPVGVVHLDLHEIPRNVEREHVVEHPDIAVERPAQVTYAPRFAFAEQEIHHAVVEITGPHQRNPRAAADRVEQVVVEIVRLQLFERTAVHGQRIFTRVIRKIRELRRQEIFVAGMTAQCNAGRPFRKSLHIDRRCVEIVYAVSDGIIDQLVHRFLVHFVAFAVAARPGRPAHAAVPQQRHPFAGVRIGPVGHLVCGNFSGGCCGTFAVFRSASGQRSDRTGDCGGPRQAGGPVSQRFEECPAIHAFAVFRLHRSFA